MKNARYLYWVGLFLLFLSSGLLENLAIGFASVFGIILTLLIVLMPLWLMIGLHQRITNRQNPGSQEKKEPEVQPEPEPQPEPAKPKQPDRKELVDFIEKFSELDVIIENEVISEELVRCQQYLAQISRIETEFPETRDKNRKLYEYYLPMLADILNDYVKILQAKTQVSAEYEERLVRTLKLVNSALETIAINLVQQYYDSMNVDIKTLESLLRKDGLVDDFSSFSSSSEKKVTGK